MSVKPVVVVSAPCAANMYPSSAVPASLFRPAQIMFGTDAQVASILQVLDEAAIPAVFTPCPENFSCDVSYRAILIAAGLDNRTSNSMIHLRFGLTTEARVLKRALNCLFEIRSHCRTQYSLGKYFALEGDYIPNAFTHVATFGPSHRKIFRTGGDKPVDIPAHEILSVMQLAFTNRSPDQTPHLRINDLKRLPFSAYSFCEFAEVSSGWMANRRGSLEKSIRFINSFRSKASDALENEIVESSLIALPFNLSDPAGAIDDLIRSFTIFDAFSLRDVHLVLLPFNDYPDFRLISEFVRSILDLGKRYGKLDVCRENLFVAHVSGRDYAKWFSSVFPVAVVDGLCPDMLWTIDRMAAVGSYIIKLSSPEDSSAETLSFTSNGYDNFYLDCDKKVSVPTIQGDVIVHSSGLTIRASAELIKHAYSILQQNRAPTTSHNSSSKSRSTLLNNVKIHDFLEKIMTG